MRHELKVAVVATNGPGTVGGLAAYLRGLCSVLGTERLVTCAVRYNRHSSVALSYARSEPRRRERARNAEVFVLAAGRAWRPALRFARRAMFYPSMQPVARRTFAAAYATQLERALPPDLDVVHVIGTGWEMMGPAVLSLARRRGAAVTVCPAVHPGSWGDSAFDVAFYNETDAVIALSVHERQHLEALGVEGHKLHVCGLAPSPALPADGSRFRARHGLIDRPMVLFVGRKQRYKGYHVLIEAIERVKMHRPDTVLVAIGADGEPVLGASHDSVIDLGTVDDHEKADALAACDVFCLPSDGESFGIAYVEAWSYGKPVVGGSAPAVRELIQDGVDGFSVRRDPEELARVLVRLLEDAELRARLGAAGQARQRRDFTWEAVVEEHRRVFSRALRSSRETEVETARAR